MSPFTHTQSHMLPATHMTPVCEQHHGRKTLILPDFSLCEDLFFNDTNTLIRIHVLFDLLYSFKRARQISSFSLGPTVQYTVEHFQIFVCIFYTNQANEEGCGPTLTAASICGQKMVITFSKPPVHTLWEPKTMTTIAFSS